MPTMDEVRSMLDRNNISSKVITESNPQLDWILVCEKYSGSQLNIGIAQIKATEQIEIFVHMNIGDDVKQLLAENNFNNEFINELQIRTLSLPHITAAFTPNLPNMKKFSVFRRLSGDFTAQKLIETLETVRDTIGLSLVVIRKHAKSKTMDFKQDEQDYIG